MAQDGTVTARQHGRHEVPVQRLRQVTDGIDAVVHPAQSPVLEPLPYSVTVHARRDELVAPHPTVLASRDPGDDVEWCADTPHSALSTA